MNLIEKLGQLCVSVSLPLLVFNSVGIDHLVSQCAQGHVGPLWDIKQLAPVWLHHPATKQGPELQNRIPFKVRSMELQPVKPQSGAEVHEMQIHYEHDNFSFHPLPQCLPPFPLTSPSILNRELFPQPLGPQTSTFIPDLTSKLRSRTSTSPLGVTRGTFSNLHMEDSH